MSGSCLADRFEALDTFVRLVGDPVARHHPPGVDASTLARTRSLCRRAGQRLGLSGEHTVVALAGATGSGKSSLFNALARLELSPAGPLRPTTGEVHACVWSPQGTGGLLDWLGVDPRRRFSRESALDAEDEAHLRGLVLLDLPDMDSVAAAHRQQADRLVDSVDLLVWVLDPQKYADSAVHEGYLRHLAPLREVTVVAFNQVDRLTTGDAARCRDDLVHLVDADGLSGVPVVATSARTGEGVGEVRALLEKAVAQRRAWLARLTAELDEAVAQLGPLVGPDRTEDAVGRDSVEALAAELAAAAGVTTLAAEGAEAGARAIRIPAGVPRRGAARSRWGAAAGQLRGGGRGLARPADPAGTAAALRRLTGSAAAGLPPPWPDAIRAAAPFDGIPAKLGEALAAALPPPPRALGWRLASGVWWLAALTAVLGAGWLGWYAVARALGWPGDGGSPPRLALLGCAGGATTALLLVLLGRPLAAARTRRWRTRALRALQAAAVAQARDVVTAVRRELRRYADARTAWHTALPAGALPAAGAAPVIRPAAPERGAAPECGAAPERGAAPPSPQGPDRPP